MRRRMPRPSPAMVVAVFALVVAAGGGASQRSRIPTAPSTPVGDTEACG